MRMGLEQLKAKAKPGDFLCFTPFQRSKINEKMDLKDAAYTTSLNKTKARLSAV